MLDEDDYAYDEGDLVDGMEVQLPGHEQFNDYGKANDILVQLNFLDLDEEGELGWIEIEDPDELAEVDPLIQEVASGDQEVPYDWQYWLHDANTIPPVDESGAPPVESGWIDPDTGQEVP